MTIMPVYQLCLTLKIEKNLEYKKQINHGSLFKVKMVTCYSAVMFAATSS